jgi:tetratricopeptide (TPR) repeat protein
MSGTNRRFWLGLLAIGAVAILLRIIHLHQIQDNPFFGHPIVDAWDYHVDALRIAQTGDWIGNRVFFQAPLFTYFLAAVYKIFGPDHLWPLVVQAGLGTLTAVGVYVLGCCLFGKRAGWIAGLATACYPLLIFYDGELLAPTLTIALDVLMFLAFFALISQSRAWLLALPGLILGIRALATTNILAVVPVFWIWLFFYGRSSGWSRRRVVLAVVAFTLGIIVAIAPVTVRNNAVTGKFVLVSSNAGINFYLGNSGDYDDRIAIRPGADWDEFVNRHVRQGLRVGPEMSGYFFSESWRYVRTHPVDYVGLLFYKAYLLLRGDEILRNQDVYPFRAYSSVLRVLLWKFHGAGGLGAAFPFGLLLPLAWPGCLLAIRKRHAAGVLLWGFAIAYGMSVIAFFVTARYRLPIVVPMVLLSAYGWTELRRWWGARRLRTWAIGGMIALSLISNWNAGSMAEDMNPDAYYCLATTLAQQGDLDGSERYYRRALELNPDDASAWVNLGLYVYEAKGMLEQAESCYRRSLTARPDYAVAVYNLARMAESRGRPGEAEWLYREAIRLDPLMSGSYNNLAAMQIDRGDFTVAHRLYQQALEIDPQNVRTLIGLGITFFKTETLTAALVFFDRARQIEPDNPDIYYNLALAYAESGYRDQAAGAARRLIELDPLDEAAYRLYAEQMRSAGRAEEAVAYLVDLIDLHPDLPGPRHALQLLRRQPQRGSR